MVAAGHEVHMVTSYRGDDKFGRDWLQSEDAGINVHWLHVPYSNHMSYSGRIKAFFRFAFAARRRAIDLKGDVIFATSTPLTIAIPAVLASRSNNIPMVFEVRDLWPEIPIAIGALRNPLIGYAARKLERWAYENSVSVVALSPGMKAGVVRTNFPPERVAVIPNSSDNDEFKYNADAAARFRWERSWLMDKPLLVYAGTFGQVNGVGYMVQLAKALQLIESDIQILLVGDGREYSDVLRRAKQDGVYKDNLFFESKILKKEVPALLSAATMASNIVIDLPEARANSANKFFDCLAAGKPIFINHGGWMHDLVCTHQCGISAWKKPIEEVAMMLDSRLHDLTWLMSASEAAKQLAQKKFDRDLLADQLIRVIQAAHDGQAEKTAEIAPGEY